MVGVVVGLVVVAAAAYVPGALTNRLLGRSADDDTGHLAWHAGLPLLLCALLPGAMLSKLGYMVAGNPGAIIAFVGWCALLFRWAKRLLKAPEKGSGKGNVGSATSLVDRRADGAEVSPFVPTPPTAHRNEAPQVGFLHYATTRDDTAPGYLVIENADRALVLVGDDLHRTVRAFKRAALENPTWDLACFVADGMPGHEVCRYPQPSESASLAAVQRAAHAELQRCLRQGKAARLWAHRTEAQ